MRKAVTIAQLVSGEWETIAHPDVPIKEQKAALKAIKTDGGVVGKKKYSEVHILFTPGKKHKFANPTEKTDVPVRDDLVNLNEEGLKKVIDREGLKVKLDKDHEKVRAAIRKARSGGKSEEKKTSDKGTDPAE